VLRLRSFSSRFLSERSPMHLIKPEYFGSLICGLLDIQFFCCSRPGFDAGITAKRTPAGWIVAWACLC
jgi:hypothetical protein